MKLTELLLEVQAATSDAKTGLRDVQRDLESFAGEEASAHMDIKGLTDVLAKLKEADAALEEYGHKEATAKVNIEVVKPRQAQLQDIIQEAQSVLGSGLSRSPGGSSSYGNESGLRAYMRDLESLKGLSRDAGIVTKDLGKEIEDLGSKSSSASGGGGGEGLGMLDNFLRSIGPVAAGAGIVLLTVLAPAIVALAASALQAVAAIGGMAVALSGLMLPAAFAGIAAMSGLSDVMAAVTAGMKAQDAAHAGNQSAIKQRTDATNQLANAQQNLLKSNENLSDSEKAYRQAVQDARQKIQDAADSESKATVALADAQQNLKEQTTNAYQAWADSIEKVKQDMFALQNAQIGVEQSHLDAASAVEKYKNDLQAASGVSQAFLDLFKRIQTVDLRNMNVGSLTKEIASVNTGTSGTTDTTLKQDLLDIVKARLSEKEATDKVGTAQTQLNRDRETELSFARQGIEAYKPYRDAVRQVLDAQDTLNKATHTYQQLLQEGVYGQQSVISAARAVRDAHFSIAQAQRQVQDASIQVQQAIGSEASAFQQAMGVLDPAEQQMVRAIMRLITGFESMTRPFVDAIARIAVGFLDGIQQAMQQHSGVITGFLLGLAGQIGRIAQTLVSPQWVDFFTMLFQQATKILPIVGGAFLDLMTIWKDIVVAAMPFLIIAFKELGGFLDGLAGKANNTKAISGLMSQFFTSFQVWLKLIADVGKLLFDTLVAVGPIGNQMVSWLDQGVKNIDKFLTSPQGKKDVKEFFQSFVPLAEQVVGVLAQVILVAADLLRILAPALQPLLSVASIILDMAASILQWLGHLGDGFFKVIGWIGLVVGGIVGIVKYGPEIVSKIGGAWRTVTGIVGDVIKFLGRVIDVIGNIGEWIGKIAGWFGDLVDAVAPIIETIIGIIGEIGSFIAEFIVPVIEGIAAAVGTVAAIIGIPVEAVIAIIAAIIAVVVLVATHIKQTGAIFVAIWHAIEAAASWAAHGISDAFNWVVGAVSGAFGWVKHAISDAINFLVELPGKAGRALVSFAGKVWDAIKGVPHLFERLGKPISDAWNWIVNAVLDAVHWLGGALSDAWNWIVGAIKDAINFLIGIINDFIKLWNSSPFGSGIHVHTPVGNVDIGGVHIPSIPKLALGGIAQQAMVGVFGEAGPEAVIPLRGDVLAKIGEGIVAAMSDRTLGGAKQPPVMQQNNTFNIDAPASTHPDPAFVTSRIADLMHQRGLGGFARVG